MMTDAPGPRLATGRDCEIFALGADRVGRRARDGRSLDLANARRARLVARA